MRAFLFDLNGTMVDDMEYHAKAWHGIINDELHAGLSHKEVKSQMYGKNNEVLKRIFGDSRFTKEQMDLLSVEKEKKYRQLYLPHLKLISGLREFLEKAKLHHIPMAIGSAAIKYNIDFVVDNLDIRDFFSAFISADDVNTSKPDPETFIKAANLLGVPAEDCIVFEDAPKGVEAAMNAGMQTVVLTTMHDAHEFSGFGNILYCIKDYKDPTLDELFKYE